MQTITFFRSIHSVFIYRLTSHKIIKSISSTADMFCSLLKNHFEHGIKVKTDGSVIEIK